VKALAVALGSLLCVLALSSALEAADKVEIAMYGVKVVDNKKKQDRSLRDILPWLRKRFPKKGFERMGVRKGRLGKRNSLTMNSPDDKTVKLTVEDVTRSSARYHLKAYWRDKKGKKQEWNGFRRTVTKSPDMMLTNGPGFKVEGGTYVVVVRSVLPAKR